MKISLLFNPIYHAWNLIKKILISSIQFLWKGKSKFLNYFKEILFSPLQPSTATVNECFYDNTFDSFWEGLEGEIFQKHMYFCKLSSAFSHGYQDPVFIQRRWWIYEKFTTMKTTTYAKAIKEKKATSLKPLLRRAKNMKK